MARPTKLTEPIQTQLTQLIRAGNTVEIAAESAGITERTFYAWMERGCEPRARDDAPYGVFREAIEQARAESEALLVARIAKAAGDGSWAAAAWLLERRFPTRWGKPAGTDKPEAKPPIGSLRLVEMGEKS